MWRLLLPILSLAFLAESQFADSEYVKCWFELTYAFKRNVTAYCSISPDHLKCFDKVYQSESDIDLIIRQNMNLKNLYTAFKYVCSKSDIIKEQNTTCIDNIALCYDLGRIKKGNWFSTNCFYEKIKTCSPKLAMIVADTFLIIKSNPCKLTNENFNLIPFYGPEMHCYPAVKNSSGTAAAKLALNYQYFCSGFNKEEVSQCIEDSLSGAQTSELVDDNYVSKAKEFFRQRSKLCDYFSIDSHKTCSSVDVLSCQEDLYKTNALLKPFDELLSNYGRCVYDTYKKCDVTLAKTIKYNLDGISNAAGLSVSFLLVISHVAIILTQFF